MRRARERRIHARAGRKTAQINNVNYHPAVFFSQLFGQWHPHGNGCLGLWVRWRGKQEYLVSFLTHLEAWTDTYLQWMHFCPSTTFCCLHSSHPRKLAEVRVELLLKQDATARLHTTEKKRVALGNLKTPIQRARLSVTVGNVDGPAILLLFNQLPSPNLRAQKVRGNPCSHLEGW